MTIDSKLRSLVEEIARFGHGDAMATEWGESSGTRERNKKIKNYVFQLKQLINEFGKILIGSDEEIMSAKEADETFKLNEGNVSMDEILSVGVQRILDRNALRSEMRERKEKLLK